MPVIQDYDSFSRVVERSNLRHSPARMEIRERNSRDKLGGYFHQGNLLSTIFWNDGEELKIAFQHRSAFGSNPYSATVSNSTPDRSPSEVRESQTTELELNIKGGNAICVLPDEIVAENRQRNARSFECEFTLVASGLTLVSLRYTNSSRFNPTLDHIAMHDEDFYLWLTYCLCNRDVCNNLANAWR